MLKKIKIPSLKKSKKVTDKKEIDYTKASKLNSMFIQLKRDADQYINTEEEQRVINELDELTKKYKLKNKQYIVLKRRSDLDIVFDKVDTDNLNHGDDDDELDALYAIFIKGDGEGEGESDKSVDGDEDESEDDDN